jgi:mRNA interferase MazF
LSPTIAPWQVWLAHLGDAVGSEQGGTRPAIVLGSDDHCRFPIEMALVIPLTSRDRGLPHHVPIASTDAGLNRPSWARTEDIRSISTRRLAAAEPIGVLSEWERTEVARWVHRMIAR